MHDGMHVTLAPRLPEPSSTLMPPPPPPPHLIHPPIHPPLAAQAQGQEQMALSPEERRQLLSHLKKKWGTLNSAYQTFSLCIDHQQKKLRKEDLEKQLAECEADIKALERGDVIMVVSE
jgi:hypothetical protein